MQRSDLVIIGGGIVGLATGYRFLERFPGKTVTVLEKESVVAKHQTGRNSGVLHSGVYYRPGSLRAQNCRTGKLAMEEFCTREGIPWEMCGKVIVAVEESQFPQLEKTLANGTANGAEVLAAALADNDRAELVGQPTAGIAGVQKLVPLADRHALWMTYARYLRVDGTPIHERGLIPDYGVNVPYVELGEPAPATDPALDKALERLKAATTPVAAR